MDKDEFLTTCPTKKCPRYDPFSEGKKLTFAELLQEGRYPVDYTYNDGKLKVNWAWIREPQIYNARLSEEYKEILTYGGFDALPAEFTRYKIDRDTIVLYPNPIESGKYSFIAGAENSNDEFLPYLFLYKGYPIKPDFSIIPRSLKEDCNYVFDALGTYKGNFVYASEEAAYMMNPEGQVCLIGKYHGVGLSMDGWIKVSVQEDDLVISEKTDNGKWTQCKLSLSNAKETLDTMFLESESEEEKDEERQ